MSKSLTHRKSAVRAKKIAQPITYDPITTAVVGVHSNILANALVSIALDECDNPLQTATEAIFSFNNTVKESIERDLEHRGYQLKPEYKPLELGNTVAEFLLHKHLIQWPPLPEIPSSILPPEAPTMHLLPK